MRSILLIFAHPDDESFFAAGAARKYADAGVRVVLCCATRGERGTAGTPPLTSIARLASVREQELREAAKVIGVEALELLPYQDQQLEQAPPAEIRAALVRLIRQYRPAIVITFDPNGGNQHPDHIAISRFTIDAVAAAADSRWLPELGAAHGVARLLWVSPVLPWEETDRAKLAAHPGVDFMIDTRSSREAKARALAAHRTQRQGIDRLFLTHPDRDEVLSTETFRLGVGTRVEAPPAEDLFAGLAASRTAG